ncbi:MAG: sugar phosphate isomerase/epimerase [Clostridia bacterium]|nr:sugar phosphate isomerase/epimerase [Clostridia bacterium]
MKRTLGFSTIACPDLPWETVLDVGAAAGMKAVEIRLDREDRPFGIPDAELPKLAAALSERGLFVSDVGMGLELTDYRPGLAEKLAPAFERADAIGAKGVRVFLGHSALRVPEGKTENEEGIVRSVSDAARVAERYSADLWIETHGTYSRARDVRRVIDAAGGDAISVIWDVFHSYETGESVEESDAILGDKTVHVHIKDGVRKKGDPDGAMTYTKVGEGEVPLARTLELLDRRGYAGVLSLEWENMWRPELRTVFPDLASCLASYKAYFDGFDK